MRILTLLCLLGLTLLPREASAASVVGAGAAVTYSGQAWAEGAVVEAAR